MHGAYGNWKLWANSSAVKSTNHLGHRIAPLKRLVVNSLQMGGNLYQGIPLQNAPVNQEKPGNHGKKKVARRYIRSAIHGNGAIL